MPSPVRPLPLLRSLLAALKYTLAAVVCLCAQATAATTLHIDCGSATDAYYTGGAPWPLPIPPPGTTDVTVRWGTAFSYHIPVDPGGYVVTLRFREPDGVAALPKRVFSVNGQTVASEVLALSMQAVGGYLDLSLTTTTRSAILSSIDVAPVAVVEPVTIIQAYDPLLMSVTILGQTRYMIEAGTVLHLSLWGPPQPGGCSVSAAVVVPGDGYLYVCEPNLPLSAHPNPWGHWARTALQRSW